MLPSVPILRYSNARDAQKVGLLVKKKKGKNTVIMRMNILWKRGQRYWKMHLEEPIAYIIADIVGGKAF
jgi:hypothetical protein